MKIALISTVFNEGEDIFLWAKSLRAQMEEHRANPICATCHSRMDPIGFGLENYDAIGGYRTMEAGQNVDSTGSFTT